jgi:hypothetical protein
MRDASDGPDRVSVHYIYVHRSMHIKTKLPVSTTNRADLGCVPWEEGAHVRKLRIVETAVTLRPALRLCTVSKGNESGLAREENSVNRRLSQERERAPIHPMQEHYIQRERERERERERV